MNPTDVYNVLLGIDATQLYHANSVTTSCTFLEYGGLLSRGYVEDHRLSQTPQYSDNDDKKYGIWHRIFVDHVDIHHRAGRTKGPNKYGPVLFVLDSDVLTKLPKGSEVSVTKKNPVNWRQGEPIEEQWFKDTQELAANLSYGDFDKILVIKTPSGTLDFPDRQVQIFLDNPKRKISSGDDAYPYAEKRLRVAARSGKVKVSIDPHKCRPNCSCLEIYARVPAKRFDLLFT
jgi:hypothetical protein